MRRGAPRRLVGLVFAGAAAIAPAFAAETTYGESGLPLPRFASLRADEVNLRTGPGVRYPVEWVYRRRGLPVEITAEYDTWRRVRDSEGTEGWMHRSMLSGRRTVLVTGLSPSLRAEPDMHAGVLARLERRVIARLLTCTERWCRVEVERLRGWIRRVQLWGVGADERVE